MGMLALLWAADDRPRLHALPLEFRNLKTGPAVGAHIPPLDVTDSAGVHQNFDTLKGPKGLVLLFVRSAAWSLACQNQLTDLDRHAGEFRKKGLGVAAISYDSGAVLGEFAEKQKITMALLSDPGSRVMTAFGILNPNLAPAGNAWGTPFPGTFMVDERGMVTAKYFHDDPGERFSAAAILAHEFMTDGMARVMIDTPQLTLTYSVSDAQVTPGTRISLLIDIDPKPKMHVFAPGAPGYFPVEWQMGASRGGTSGFSTAGWVTFPLIYPAGRSMKLPAIGETVPSYDRHIRLVRDVVIGQENEIAPVLTPGRSVALEGAFRYQACDEKECFLPRSLLLHWSVNVRGSSF